MNWKQNGKLLPWWITITQTWGSKSGNGRYWKRRLSKARRRYWKDTHKRGLMSIESTCNWKGW